jgi:hypothetical protein
MYNDLVCRSQGRECLHSKRNQLILHMALIDVVESRDS